VAYRGFYSEDAARKHAAKLRSEGFDVYVGGVLAYSTLGWFDDPLLSTFIRYPESQVARLVFHELAHQVVYAKHDTTFNESLPWWWRTKACAAGSRRSGRKRELEPFRARRRASATLAARIKDTTRAPQASSTAQPHARAECSSRSGREFRPAARRVSRLRAGPSPTTPSSPRSRVYNELVPGFEDGCWRRAAAWTRSTRAPRSCV
jgi:predicted aminopeptidase